MMSSAPVHHRDMYRTRSGQDQLPSIRTLFAEHNLFPAEPDRHYRPSLSPRDEYTHPDFGIQHEVSGIRARSPPLVLDEQRIQSSMTQMSLDASAYLASRGTEGSVHGSDHSPTHEDGASETGSEKTSDTNRQRRGHRKARARAPRPRKAQDARTKQMQMVRNRIGRRSENSWMRLLEHVLEGLGMASGTRQIVTNQHRSGLHYTKCSNLETAIYYLLMLRPLIEALRTKMPEMIRSLEHFAGQVMERFRGFGEGGSVDGV